MGASRGGKGREASFDALEEEITGLSQSLPPHGQRNAGVPLGARDRATLTVIAGQLTGTMYTLAPHTLVGRGIGCDIRIDDPVISRNHARITRQSTTSYLLMDLQSRHGTFVNGEKVEARLLMEGDRVSFGRGTVLHFDLRDELEEVAFRRLYESSVLDGLTGAFNRGHFSERLAAEIAYARRHSVPLSLLMFDLDHFKKVNDTWGHLAGDHVLSTVAALVKRALRTEDVFARYGGEEFVIIARGTDLAQAILFAERLRCLIGSAPVEYEGQSVSVTISAGVASLSCCHRAGGDVELVDLADKRLYAAKSAGRNRSVPSL